MENIILNNKKHIKIIDFNSAITSDQDITSIDNVFTEEYAAPESLLNSQFNNYEELTKLDIYSMGIILYKLAYNEFPYRIKYNRSNIKKLLNNIEYSQNTDLDKLIRRMLEFDNHKRIKMIGILNNKWFKKMQYELEDIINKNECHTFEEINDIILS